MQIPKLYPIVNLDDLLIDHDYNFNNAIKYCRILSDSGISLLQLRGKNVPSFVLTEVAKSIMTHCPNIRLIINDHLECVIKSRACGVHLGQDDVSPLEARRILGPKAIIGFSTHSLTEVTASNKLPVDYIGIGPVFCSPSKNGHAKVLGISELTKCVQAAEHPTVAIGGITTQNARDVYKTGIECIAVISTLQGKFTPLCHQQSTTTSGLNAISWEQDEKMVADTIRETVNELTQPASLS